MNFTVDFEPIGLRFLCEEPLTISAAACLAGVSLKSECRGRASCGKCKIRVHGSGLSPITQAENEHLSENQLAEGWRLACRTVVSQDVSIYVPVTSRVTAQVFQIDSEIGGVPPTSLVRVLPIKVTPPSLDDQLADLERLAIVLKQEHTIENLWAGLPALKSLRTALREGDWQITVALRGEEVIATYPSSIPTLVGLAVDVGTTKLAFYLVDLSTGQTLATKGVMNPQIAYGEDVMSRLGAAMVDQMNALRLQMEVIQVIDAVAEELCLSRGLTKTHLLDICLVGNTAMHHLLLGLPTRPLAVIPFVPALTAPIGIYADQLGLASAPGAQAYLPPPIAGFIGSDHLAFLLAAGFGEDTRIKLGIDIGTNTEIALQVGEEIVSCSTASGPAFEGAHISHGMRAALGAIERVKISQDGTVHFDVIGDEPALGICGSGILDVLAELRSAGIINLRGRLNPDKPGVRSQNGRLLNFVLVSAIDGRREIMITQEDIDQILLAKGAIRAGIDILMDYLNVSQDDIDEVVIAGAFGTNLDPCNAVRIGLLPNLPVDRVNALGNAAGAGARMMLVSSKARKHAVSLAKKIGYLELTVYPDFNKYFANAVRLPQPLL